MATAKLGRGGEGFSAGPWRERHSPGRFDFGLVAFRRGGNTMPRWRETARMCINQSVRVKNWSRQEAGVVHK